MREPVTFDQLPELLKERITGCNEAGISSGVKVPKILKCVSDPKETFARCITQDGGVFGIWDQYHDNVTYTFLHSMEVILLFEALGGKS